jgi:hypothetical protein
VDLKVVGEDLRDRPEEAGSQGRPGAVGLPDRLEADLPGRREEADSLVPVGEAAWSI